MKSYYRKKAEYAKKLYDKGLPWVKVYAAVKDGEEYIVLEKVKDDCVEYQLAGGGVEKRESLEKAIIREVKEELNCKVKVIKELGIYDKLYVPFKLDEEEFEVQYEIHVFETEVIKNKDGKLGIKGEFDKSIRIARIDKETMINTVAEFNKFNIKI